MLHTDENPHAHPLCHHCGEPTRRRDLTHADDLRDETLTLLGLGDRGHACRVCVDRADREVDAAEEALAIDEDPAFGDGCDARRTAWIAAMEADTAAQWASVVRCGAALDAAVGL